MSLTNLRSREQYSGPLSFIGDDLDEFIASLRTELEARSTSGTYTPTLTSVANVAAATAFTSQWLRVGNVVTVSGKVDIDPTAATTLTVLGISLPVASDIATEQQCCGTASAYAVASYSAAVVGNAAGNRADLAFTAGSDHANRTWAFTFTYLVA